MPRAITTTTGVTFSIDVELSGDPRGNADIVDGEEEIEYIVNGQVGDIDCFILESASMNFVGAITPVAETTPGEVANWRFGVAQNTNAYRREAMYGPTTCTLKENLQYGTPIKDGEPANLPCSYKPLDLQIGTQQSLANISETDEPKWVIPQEMETGATPLTTSSDVGLASWMMLARVVDPVQIILLGRLDWSVHLDARIIGGTLRYTAPGHVTRTDGTYVLYNAYTAQNYPALGTTGYLVPDLRDTIEANDYRQGIVTQGGVEVRRWKYNDEAGAISWKSLPNPDTYPNWITMAHPSPAAATV